MLFFWVFTLTLGLLFAAIIYGLCRLMDIPMPWEVSFDADTVDLGPAPDRSPEIRACPACGTAYHKSWGRLCPDCSGAD